MMRHWAAGVLALLAGCSAAGGDASSPITMRDSAGITIVSSDLARLPTLCAVDSAPTTLIGVAESAPEYMLHRVFGATQLSDGRIVLVNQGTEEIRYYDRDGKFLMRAGRHGQGPGEFSDAFLIWPTRGDTVYVGDYDPWQFLVFGPDGKWVRTVRPTPVYINSPTIIGVLSDGTTLLSQDEEYHGSGSEFRMQHIAAVIHDPTGAFRDTLAILPNGRHGQSNPGPQNVWMRPWFEAAAQAAAGGTAIATGYGDEPELRLRDQEHRLEVGRIVRWTTGSRTVAHSDIAAAKTDLIAEYPDISPEMRARLIEPLVSDARPASQRFPAFDDMRFGRDARLWVREYHRESDASLEHWIGFDSAGRYTCRFSIPSSQELLEIGPDYLLTEDPDADGVERVARFTLGQPGSP